MLKDQLVAPRSSRQVPSSSTVAFTFRCPFASGKGNAGTFALRHDDLRIYTTSHPASYVSQHLKPFLGSPERERRGRDPRVGQSRENTRGPQIRLSNIEEICLRRSDWDVDPERQDQGLGFVVGCWLGLLSLERYIQSEDVSPRRRPHWICQHNAREIIVFMELSRPSHDLAYRVNTNR